MSAADIILVGLIMLGGGIVQSAAGFGYGLFSVTLLLLVGWKPYEAIPAVAFAVFLQGVVGLWHHRDQISWHKVLPIMAAAIVGQPIGVYLLHRITVLTPEQVRQIFGLIVLAVLLFQWFAKVEPREHVHWTWGVAAMFTGGLMGGLCGMSGPPVVFWVMAHHWSSHRTRATLWAFFVVTVPTNVLFLYLQFGQPVLHGAGMGLLFSPAILLGAVPGIWLGNRLPKTKLRLLATVLLVLIAVYAIAQPLLNNGGA